MTAISPTPAPKPLDLFSSGAHSVQLMFAALQLKMSQVNRDKAMEKMDTIKKNQDLAKETADMIARARQFMSQCKDGSSSTMPRDMRQFFDKHGIPLAADMIAFRKEEWEFNIKSLTNYQEQLGADTQQLMVFIQDHMGQYNAYLTGANSSIREANQTLASIARGQ